MFFNDRMNLRPIWRSRGRKRQSLQTNWKRIVRNVLIIYWNKLKFLHILWQIRAQSHQTNSKQSVDRRKIKMSPMLESKCSLFVFLCACNVYSLFCYCCYTNVHCACGFIIRCFFCLSQPSSQKSGTRRRRRIACRGKWSFFFCLSIWGIARIYWEWWDAWLPNQRSKLDDFSLREWNRWHFGRWNGASLCHGLKWNQWMVPITVFVSLHRLGKTLQTISLIGYLKHFK